MAKFRKKPIEVDAVQWLGEMSDVVAVIGHDFPKPEGASVDALLIVGPTGDQMVLPNDWILKHPDGRIDALRPDVFAAIYDPVEG